MLAIGTESFIVAPLAVLLLGLPAGLLLRVIAERRARRRSDLRVLNLRRYVAPALADQIAEQARPDFAGRRQPAAVLFVDIAAFTGLSQGIGPERTSSLLRAFHRAVEDNVHAEGGVLTGLMGDGAMAVFGLPDVHDDDAVRALAAARSLARTMADWRLLRIGIGVHCGPVVIEQIGGQAQVQITATGVLRRSTAAARRPRGRAERIRYRFADWELDMPTRRLRSSAGEVVALTASEFNLLVAFLRAPQQVLSRDQLLAASRVHDEEVFDRSIDVQILRLRRKIEANPSEPRLITTERGVGYAFAVAVETL